MYVDMYPLTLHRGFVVGKRACDGSLRVSCDPKDLLTWTCLDLSLFWGFSRRFVSSCERRENLPIGSYLRLCNFTQKDHSGVKSSTVHKKEEEFRRAVIGSRYL